MPAADMQWRARKIAMQAAKLADQAGPMTRKAAAEAAVWAKPKVGRMRAWMAVRAARGSVSVQEDMAPRISAMLSATARRLDPPRPRSRRWPRVFAGTALLTAGAAAAMAMSIRRRSRFAPPPMDQPARSASDQRSTMVSSNAEADRTMAEPNGLSKTR
jgi:hypothetical protein